MSLPAIYDARCSDPQLAAERQPRNPQLAHDDKRYGSRLPVLPRNVLANTTLSLKATFQAEADLIAFFLPAGPG